jgi:hypothetical protein
MNMRKKGARKGSEGSEMTSEWEEEKAKGGL